jgi:hypothetical protein
LIFVSVFVGPHPRPNLRRSAALIYHLGSQGARQDRGRRTTKIETRIETKTEFDKDQDEDRDKDEFDKDQDEDRDKDSPAIPRGLSARYTATIDV